MCASGVYRRHAALRKQGDRKAREQVASRRGHCRVRASIVQSARRRSRILQAVSADEEERREMILRSMLFVPGDSERKLAKGEGSGADTLVLDLEDSVPAPRIEIARSMVREYLGAHRDRSRQELWVRINPLSTDKALPDLAAITAGAPDGILLPKTTSASDVVVLDHYLSALEARERVAAGSIRIIAVATETPAAMFTPREFAGCRSRLAALA